jgi:hypothetical protein
MHVFYISHIYKSATSSHTKPGLFETTSLTLLLTSSWIFSFWKPSRTVTLELVLQQTPEFHRLPISWFRRFVASGLHEFATLRLRRFMALGLHEFTTSRLRLFEIPDLRTFVTLRLRKFKILDLREFFVPENIFHEFHEPRRFEGDRFSWIPQH